MNILNDRKPMCANVWIDDSGFVRLLTYVQNPGEPFQLFIDGIKILIPEYYGEDKKMKDKKMKDIKMGDKVKIIRRPLSSDIKTPIHWNSEADAMIGMIYEVEYMNDDNIYINNFAIPKICCKKVTLSNVINISQIKQNIVTWADKVDQNNITDWIYYLNLYLKSLGWNKKARKSFVSLGSDGFSFDRLDYTTLWYNFYYDVAQYFKEDISIETILKLHIAYRNIRINCDGAVIV